MKALIDNSSFAGVMRCYEPSLPMHEDFWEQYPEHREVDLASLAQFLTAICLFDQIYLDSSSLPSGYGWEEEGVLTKGDEVDLEGYNPLYLEEIDFSGDSNSAPTPWVEEMLQYLPNSIRNMISINRVMPRQKSLSHGDSCKLAYDILCSALHTRLILKGDWKIPNVYTDPSYLFRHTFEDINSKNMNLLDDTRLAYAMFLHRGLYLLSLARNRNYTYLPYLYRGNMLTALSPLIAAAPWPNEGGKTPRIPLAQGFRPDEDEVALLLNKVYYDILEKTTWYTYDERLPFIGAAILAKAKGVPEAAFEIALKLRNEGNFKQHWGKLRKLVQEGERGKFESMLCDLRRQLEEAAVFAGARLGNKYLQPSFRLAVSCIPSSLAEIVKNAVNILPERLQYCTERFFGTLISRSPLQILFLDHVNAIRYK